MDNLARDHIDINTLRLLYGHYKSFVVPFLVIVLVIGVFIKVNVPAIYDLLKGYEDQKSARIALEDMRSNLNLLKRIDGSNLDSQFKIASKALPVNKDFDGVLNAISDASNTSRVALGGFKFMVGSLSKDEGGKELPTLNLSVNLVGNVEDVDKFMDRLGKTLPLSEIVKISAKKDASILTIDFYYKPLKPSKPGESLHIGQISNKGLSLIGELSSFSIPQTPGFDSGELPISTPSANPFF